MPRIRLLTPPYHVVDGLIHDLPPLGTIAVVEAESVEAIGGESAQLLRRAPWCTLCLVATAGTADPAVLSAIHSLPGQLCFTPGPIAVRQLTDRVTTAVRSRVVPGSGYLADYVVRRTGRAEIRAELALLMARPVDVPISEAIPGRTIRDRLRRFGPLTAHCWRAVGTLARVAATIDDASVDVLAWRAGVGVRTFRSWTRRYLGVSVRRFRARLGWEWVMEAALRHAGLVAPVERVEPTLVALPPSLRRQPERFAARPGRRPPVPAGR